MIRTRALNHISLSVADPDASLAFCTKLFGVREYVREGDVIPALGPGPDDAIVFEKRARHGQRGEIDHFGFRLTDPNDIDDAVRDAKAAGRMTQPALLFVAPPGVGRSNGDRTYVFATVGDSFRELRRFSERTLGAQPDGTPRDATDGPIRKPTRSAS